jgi:hypothetical protein
MRNKIIFVLSITGILAALVGAYLFGITPACQYEMRHLPWTN